MVTTSNINFRVRVWSNKLIFKNLHNDNGSYHTSTIPTRKRVGSNFQSRTWESQDLLPSSSLSNPPPGAFAPGQPNRAQTGILCARRGAPVSVRASSAMCTIQVFVIPLAVAGCSAAMQCTMHRVSGLWHHKAEYSLDCH